MFCRVGMTNSNSKRSPMAHLLLIVAQVVAQLVALLAAQLVVLASTARAEASLENDTAPSFSADERHERLELHESFEQRSIEQSAGLDWQLQALISPFSSLSDPFIQTLTSRELTTFDVIASGLVSLLDYIRSNVTLDSLSEEQMGIEVYNRRLHFGGWINADPEDDCLDTRNEVLVRDAKKGSSIKFRTPANCFVVKGQWVDPYSGATFRMANALQIDHVVPLKNAYLSGAHSWRGARRCHYANYMGSVYHLRTVSGHENMTKGGRGPERYMPPDPSFACQYLNDWMKIKAIWSLSVTESELAGVEALLKNYNCRASAATISVDELRMEQRASNDPPAKCVDFENRPAVPNQQQ